MLIKKAPDIRSSEITPKSVYLRRREFIQASAAALVAAGFPSVATPAAAQGGGLAKLPNVHKSPLSTTEAPSLYEHVTSYNNFYEFAPGAGDGPKNNSKNFKPRPWKIKIDGLVAKPGDYDIDEFIKPYMLEERVYRMRCVEAWSFVIPWVGIPMAEVIKRVEPTAKARFVEMTTLHDVGRFPMQQDRRAAVAVHRRAAPGRSAKPVDAAGRRDLWRGAAGTERRADPTGGALEVRLQGRQVHRPNPIRREPAEEHVAESWRRTSTASTRT